MTNAVKRLVDFVEGRLTPKEFERLLYHDSELQQLLQAERVPSDENDSGEDAYTHLLQFDFADPTDLLDMQEEIGHFLERRGITFKPAGAYQERYDLLVRGQPDWLDLDLNWLEHHVLPEAGGRTGPELETWLRGRLLELFRCVGEPPDWIQSPDWPINENGPLVFLGQLSVLDYFHDEAAAYLFHDSTTGACQTIIQVF